VTADALVDARLTAQLLSGPLAGSVDAVVERLLAVQAQDGRGARLAVRSRTSGLTASDVDDALWPRRVLVSTWLNRGTLHLVAADDYWWLHPLTTPQLATGNARRLQQEGVSAAQAARGVAVIAEAVAADGPQTRAQLRRRLDASRIPTAGQALVHLLFAASLRGDLVRGPMIGKQHAFVSAAQWLGTPPDPLDVDTALAALARRYLAGHGPASAADLAKWAGITLGGARRAFGGIADELDPFGDDLFVLGTAGGAVSTPRHRLLGPFDPLLLGWTSRGLFVGPHGPLVMTGGLFRPVGLIEGRVVATWGLRDGIVTITPLEKIARVALESLVDDAADVLRFLGLPERPVVVDRTSH
jgi:hypothetical protein